MSKTNNFVWSPCQQRFFQFPWLFIQLIHYLTFSFQNK